MEQEELPGSLVIVGGGYIGLEFASMYASFGSKVTVLEGSDRLLAHEDEDIAQAVRDTLERKGISFQFNVEIKSIKSTRNEANIFYIADGRETGIKAKAVLLATGRKPCAKVLCSEETSVQLNEKGVLRLYCMFIDPPLSHVGLHEEEARAKGYDIRINKIKVSAIARTVAIGEPEGMIKAIIDKKTDLILGCTLFCDQSNEIINMVSIAIRTGQEASFLRDFIFTHPSMCESFNDLFK